MVELIFLSPLLVLVAHLRLRYRYLLGNFKIVAKIDIFLIKSIRSSFCAGFCFTGLGSKYEINMLSNN